MTGQSPQPPGWYPDPAQPGFLRYWDGTEWSTHTHPLPVPTPPKPTAAGRGCLIAILVVVGLPVLIGGVVAAIVALETAMS